MFSSSHVWIWELNHNEGWALKNWSFCTVVLKTLETPLEYKEIQPVNPKGNQSWIFIARTETEAEVPILWLPDVRNQFTGKDPDAGKDGKQEKGTTKNEMVGWYHWLNGYKFEQGLGDCEGQGSLVCCSPWGHKQSDTTERWNSNNLSLIFAVLITVCLGVVFFGLILFGNLNTSWTWMSISFPSSGMFSTIISSKCSLFFVCLLSFSSYNVNVSRLDVVLEVF